MSENGAEGINAFDQPGAKTLGEFAVEEKEIEKLEANNTAPDNAIQTEALVDTPKDNQPVKKLIAEEKDKDAEVAPENKEPREIILEAFTEAFAIFENYPKDKLDPKQLYVIEITKVIRERSLAKGQDYYSDILPENKENGKPYTRHESVLIDDLCTFLVSRASSGELSPADKIKYQQWEQKLRNNCRNLDTTPDERLNSKWHARVTQEVERIQNYPDLVNSILQGRKEATDEEKLRAGVAEILFARRELKIPHKGEPVIPKPKIEVHTGALAAREVDVYKKARELASKLVQAEMQRGSAFNPLNWGRKVGVYLLRPYWEQRLAGEIVKQSEAKHNAYSTLDFKTSKLVLNDLWSKTGNLTVNTGVNLEEEKLSALAKVKSIKERFEEGLTESGRKFSAEVKADIIEAKGEVKKTLDSKIIKRIVLGEIKTETELQTALAQLVLELQANPNPDQDIKNFMELFGSDANQFNKLTQYFASDLLQQGLDVKADIDKAKGEMATKLLTIEQRTKYLLANPKWGAESQAYYGVTDKIAVWFASKRPGALVNAGTVGLGVAICGAVLTRGATAAQIAGLSIPGFSALFGGGAAYIRKRQEYSANRNVYNLENAYNETPTDKKMEDRAKIFKNSNYETKKSTELLDTLIKSTKPPAEMKEADRQRLVDAIADISSRMRFNESQSTSNKPTIDLITFEGRFKVEQERATLDHELIVARRALRESLKSSAKTVEPTLEGKALDAKVKQNAQALIDTAIEARLRAIKQDYDQKNSQFNKEATVASISYAAKVAALGFAGGLVSQEGLAVAARLFPVLTKVPLVGSWLFKSGTTTIEHGYNSVAPQVGLPKIGTNHASLDTLQNLFNKGGTVDINANTSAQVNPDHTVTLIDKSSHLAIPNQPEFSVDANGQIKGTIHVVNGNTDLIKEIQTELNAHGFKVDIVDQPGTTVTEGAKEYFEKLDVPIEKSNRGEWLNNGTPGKYDFNELRLDLKQTPDGLIKVDMSRMIQENTIPASVNHDIITNPDGSRTYNNFSTQFTIDDAGNNAREVIRIPMGSNGEYIIPNDSAYNKLFQRNPDGTITQLAKFTEVVHFNGTNYDILATSQGAGLNPITTTTPGTFTLDATAPLATEFTPPVLAPLEESAPILPIVPEWGKPLIMTDQKKTEQTAETPAKKESMSGTEQIKKTLNKIERPINNFADLLDKPANAVQDQLARLTNKNRAQATQQGVPVDGQYNRASVTSEENPFIPQSEAWNAMENHEEAERLLPIWRAELSSGRLPTNNAQFLEEIIRRIETKWADLKSPSTATVPTGGQPTSATSTPPKSGLFSRAQNRVEGTFDRLANAADNTIDRSFDAIRDATKKKAKKVVARGVRAVSRENLIEIGRNMRASSEELDATLAANNERFMQEILPVAIKYTDSIRELIDTGVIKINPKLAKQASRLGKKLESLVQQTQTADGKSSIALRVEVERTVNSLQQIVGEKLKERKQVAEAHATARAIPITPVKEEIMPKQLALEFTDEQKGELLAKREDCSELLQQRGTITPNNLDEFNIIFSLVINRWPEINTEPNSSLNKLVNSIFDKIDGMGNKQRYANLLANLFSQPEIQQQYPQLYNFFNGTFSKAEEAIIDRQYNEFMYTLAAALDISSS